MGFRLSPARLTRERSFGAGIAQSLWHPPIRDEGCGTSQQSKIVGSAGPGLLKERDSYGRLDLTQASVARCCTILDFKNQNGENMIDCQSVPLPALGTAA